MLIEDYLDFQRNMEHQYDQNINFTQKFMVLLIEMVKVIILPCLVAFVILLTYGYVSLNS